MPRGGVSGEYILYEEKKICITKHVSNRHVYERASPIR